MKDADKSAFLGFRSSDYVVLTDEFEAASDRLSISTDDGSVGYKGIVTDLLEKDIAERALTLFIPAVPCRCSER